MYSSMWLKVLANYVFFCVTNLLRYFNLSKFISHHTWFNLRTSLFLFVSVTQFKILMHRRGIDNCLLSTEVSNGKGNSLHKVHIFLEDIDFILFCSPFAYFFCLLLAWFCFNLLYYWVFVSFTWNSTQRALWTSYGVIG